MFGNVGGVEMEHILCDALKISPIPLETANRTTATGWMLEIERILNDILEKSDGHYRDLEITVRKVLQESKDKINELLYDLDTYKVTKEYADKIFQHIREELVKVIADLVGEGLQYITFGVENGRFVAYVPDNMKGIEFEMSNNPESEDYGKLVIKY